MASITNEPGGRRTIQFVGIDGKRRSVRLGKTSKQTAEAIKLRIEKLLASRRLGEPADAELRRWLGSAETALLEKLARGGLIDCGQVSKLGELCKNYLDTRVDLKPKTRAYLRNTSDRLVAYFGAERIARTITSADAADWRRWMLTEGLSEATLREASIWVGAQP
mgnify:CR=1 FL=1